MELNVAFLMVVKSIIFLIFHLIFWKPFLLYVQNCNYFLFTINVIFSLDFHLQPCDGDVLFYLKGRCNRVAICQCFIFKKFSVILCRTMEIH